MGFFAGLFIFRMMFGIAAGIGVAMALLAFVWFCCGEVEEEEERQGE